MMRSNTNVGWFLLIAVATMPLLAPAQEGAASRDANYETALQEIEALRNGRAAPEDGPSPLIRLARPASAPPAAPAQPLPQADNANAEARNTSPTAPSTPAGDSANASESPGAQQAPRGILAPFFDRTSRNTPPLIARNPNGFFAPRHNTNDPSPTESQSGSRSQSGTPAPAPSMAEAASPLPANNPIARTGPATVPSLPIRSDRPAMLMLAERTVAPPAIAPAPPERMVMGFAPTPANETPEAESRETSPQPKPQVVEAAPRTVRPTVPEIRQPQPEPQVVVEPAPTFVPRSIPDAQPQPERQQRVVTIDRNHPQVPPVVTQHPVPRPAPPISTRPVLRPITPEPPALPELAVFMGGADKVLHGENVSVKVRVVNSGRGAAREVILDIVGNDQLLKTLPIGAVPAGRSVEVEIQLTPQILGEIELQAVAKARDGERAVAVRSMFVGKPELSLAIAGPATVNFGEVQIYTAIIDNKGNADAQEVSLLIMLQGKEAQSLVLGNVLAGQRRRVSFELRPELGGVLSLNAVATGVGNVQAVANGSINVMQQQIELTIDGPRTLQFGDAARYTLNLKNVGNTDAEQVVVNVNLGDSVLDGLFEGTLAMGEKKQVMFEVSPARPGNQTLTAVALSGGGANAAATARLQVQHGQLELTAAGPNAKFSGGNATYDVKIKNVGDAAAEDILLTAHLPTGAQFVGGVDKIEFYEGVTWRVGTLQPGEERNYPLACLLEAAGEQAIIFSASGAGELSATHKVVTNVEALADIRLYVADPQGLVAIGEDAVYEIELHNRGVKAAHDVQLKLLLGDVIRPRATEGLAAQLDEKGVTFETIERLDPKETRKIRVTLQAIQEGSHQFRVEVSATDPQTFVASEGTTRFYAKAKPIAPAPATEPPVERTATPGGSTWR